MIATRKVCSRFLFAGLIIMGIVVTPSPGAAHPLGNFSISHYAAIRVEPHGVKLLYIIDMAEIPTFQEIQATGIVPQEGDPPLTGYLTRKAEVLGEEIVLEINGQRLNLQKESAGIIFPPGAGGLPTMKIGVRYHSSFEGATLAGINRLLYRDNNFPDRAGWKEIIAIQGSGIAFGTSSVSDQDRSRELTDYPTDLLNSPPQDLEARLTFAVEGSSVPAARAGGTKVASLPTITSSTTATDWAESRSSTDQVTSSNEAEARRESTPLPLQANWQATPRNHFTQLVASEQLGLGVVLIALAVAAGLGAFHALEPGHGKTVVAAYLVGSRGTPWHALLLGLIVTASHTAGVYLLGAVTLHASKYVVPERLYPWLGLLSGLIIAGLGFSLLLRRYSENAHLYSHEHPHNRNYSHHHKQAHNPQGLDGGAAHTHGLYRHHHYETRRQVSFRQLLALGMSGGIIPCPAALVVLLGAISLGRTGFGLLLIVAFSVGLAAVLIAIGLLIVYTRHFMSRFQGEGSLITRWLPMISAAVITIFGVAIALQALVAEGIIQIRL